MDWNRRNPMIGEILYDATDDTISADDVLAQSDNESLADYAAREERSSVAAERFDSAED